MLLQYANGDTVEHFHQKLCFRIVGKNQFLSVCWVLLNFLNSLLMQREFQGADEAGNSHKALGVSFEVPINKVLVTMPSILCQSPGLSFLWQKRNSLCG